MQKHADSGHFICITCGTQFGHSYEVPANCAICLDDRQYIWPRGQLWTTLDALRRDEWRNHVRMLEYGLWEIVTEPKFAIGQRGLLVQSEEGNLLWDCVSLLDLETIERIRGLGGIQAIAISHPHYYTTMVEWSRAFDNAPIYLHEADRRWVMRPDRCIQHWAGGTKALFGGLTLVHTAGHFEGFQVLHWPGGADGNGVLFSGDQPQVCADPHWVSFMYSYPNYIPLNASAILRILNALAPFRYDRIYSAFSPGLVIADAEMVVRRSAERYMRAILG